MGNVKILNVKILSDIRQFSSDMQNVIRTSKAIGKEMQDLGKSLTMSVTLPLVGLAAASLKAFADIDTLKRGLTAVTGSAAAAESEFSKLREVAKLPGLGLNEAVKGSINLQAIGVSADEARRIMLSFGNAIATVGGGKMNFDLAIRGFSQLRNASKPMQQDLYQIANQLPQVNKLMIEAFGTNRAEDLAAMGISGKQLSEFLVASLEKLPPVVGGIGNSFENFGDSMKITFATIGESLNRAFDIEGIINGISGFMSGLADKFSGLSPSMQKVIFSIAGIAASIGPVLLLLGTLGTTVIPAVIRGMGLLRAVFLTNPFGIIAAAVVLAIGLIISNWDKIVSYFNGGDGSAVFEKLHIIVSAAMQGIGLIIEGVTNAIRFIWDAFGGYIINFTTEFMKGIMDRINVALTYVFDLFENMIVRVLGIWKFFKGLFTGDWSLMWEGMVDVVASFVNAIVEGIRFMVKNVLGPMKTLADAVGLEGVSGAMDTALNSVDSFFNAIKMETKGTQEAADIMDKFRDSIKGVASAKVEAAKVQDVKAPGEVPTFTPIVDNKAAIQEAELENLRTFNKAKQDIEMEFATGAITSEQTAAMLKEEALVAFHERKLNIAKEYGASEIEAKNELEDALFQRDLMAVEHTKATEEAKRAARQATANSVVSSGQQILGSLVQLAGKSKGLALFEIAVNTAIGVAKAVAAGAGMPYPTNIPAILSGVAAVVGGIASAKSALSKAPAFATGGAVMGGPTMSLLGDNPSGKEAIIPFERMTEFASRLVGNVGGGVVQVVGEVKIAGRDMILLLRNAERAEDRFA